LASWNDRRCGSLIKCGVLALGALNGNLPEPLPTFFQRRRAALICVKVHMGDILLWAVVGFLFVVAALVIFAV
jgi:hypothetical protein